jgi:TolB-like protein/class 3 adenylate cyclase
LAFSSLLTAIEQPPDVASNTASSRLDRRLAAIVFADVAGFTRLMSNDEAGTLRRWKALRSDILIPYTNEQGGRIVSRPGDAMLIEFPSAVMAVRWAVDVQRAIVSRREPQDPYGLTLRIGINIEDIIIDDGIIQGDGVNIAARIHQAAEPGQIVVTGTVRDFVSNRLPLTFHDLGTPPLRNLDRSVRVYVVDWADSPAGEASIQPYLQWSTRPTVAVLPFRSIGSPDESYFGEGITEDIITGLSQSRAFYVIARNSTLRYRDRSSDIRQIASDLDVRYILDGSVRRSGRRLRINTELIDISSNRAIWSERYDGSGEDLFDFQDGIVASIVGSLEPRLRAAESARIRGRPTESLDAYDCVLKALSLLYLFTEDSYRRSGELLDRALALDPDFALAHAYTAWRLNFFVGEGRSPNPKADRARASAAARRAIELDPEDAFGLTVAGHITAFIDRRPAEAMELFERALAINENSAFAWAMSALTCAYRGSPDEALDRLRNVWRLSPFDPLNFYFWIVAGIAEYMAGHYPEAVVWLRKSRRANPRFIAGLRMLAASLALAGEEENAQQIGRELLAIDPGFRVSSFVSWYPLQREADLKRLSAALKAAGLPD